MKEIKDKVLAEGEATGHAHRARAKTAKVYEGERGHRELHAPHGTAVDHEEHKTIQVPAGEYNRLIVQEYDPFEDEVREVRD